jgi:dTDP-4-dehydrorhamnose reductase
MRVLITGSRGLLAAAVERAFGGDEVIASDRASLDITDDQAVQRVVRETAPDVVINCAAFNGVDAAEDDPIAALAVNAFAVKSLARAAADSGARLVHYSSDFVFDGETDRPYVEEDRPNPRSVYGASKLLSEWFALQHPHAFVLRVESLFGEAGPTGARRGSLRAIIDRLLEGAEVPVFVDRVVSPTATVDAATATRHLLQTDAPPGLYHTVNSGHATWLEIAQHAAAVLGVPLRAKPITLASARLQARRPRFCALSNAKLAAVGCHMRHWTEAVERYLSA